MPLSVTSVTRSPAYTCTRNLRNSKSTAFDKLAGKAGKTRSEASISEILMSLSGSILSRP